jgi:uncharacterized protein DUF4157
MKTHTGKEPREPRVRGGGGIQKSIDQIAPDVPNSDHALQARQKEMIRNSPYMASQQKKIEAAMGPVVQRENKTNLPDELKSGMESSFNQDFSHVRVHANSSKAPEVGALAYTQGSDVHFAPGQFSPGTASGRRLIGHELAHVVQQGQGRVSPTTEISGMPVNDNPSLEKEADILGSKAVQ